MSEDPPWDDLVEKAVASDATSPLHYSQFAIEPIEFIRANDLSYIQGNIIKYVCRYDSKGTPLEDLLKARRYLEWMIEEVRNWE